MSVRLTLHECYRAIVMAARGSNGASLQFATSYALYGLSLADYKVGKGMGSEARSQLLYVRSNLAGWRGDSAKQVRETLDFFIKESK